MTTDAPGSLSATAPCADVVPSMPEIFGAITDLARRLRLFESRTLRESGLTPPQFFVLSLLSKADGRPLSELADLSSCTRATMTGIADTLERKGMIRRGPNPSDRRGTFVWLTDQGRSHFAATADLGAVFGGCCCELLAPEESRELTRLLTRLADSLPF